MLSVITISAYLFIFNYKDLTILTTLCASNAASQFQLNFYCVVQTLYQIYLNQKFINLLAPSITTFPVLSSSHIITMSHCKEYKLHPRHNPQMLFRFNFLFQWTPMRSVKTNNNVTYQSLRLFT